MLLAIKLLIVIGAYYFIYQKIVYNEKLPFSEFVFQIKHVLFSNNKTVVILVFFSLINWVFEVLKWQNLVLAVKKITFTEALQQSLGSLTASLLTPNKIGEYGAKAMFYSKDKRKKIVLLNLIANVTQMFITILFGVIGVVYVLIKYSLEVPILQFNWFWVILFVVLSIGWWFFFAEKTVLFYDKVIRFLKNKALPLITRTILYSILKYIVFSHQFYYLLLIFGVKTDYVILMQLIFFMYFIASVIPSLPMFDWLVKGSVAVFVFSWIGVQEEVIISITLFMWLYNFAIPSIIGSYFVFNFKYPLKK